MISPSLLWVSSIGLSFIGGVVLHAWLRGEMEQAQCGDCEDKDREIDRLQASLESTQHQVGLWIVKAQNAEQIARRYEEEAAEDQAITAGMREEVMRRILPESPRWNRLHVSRRSPS